jgi:hypothetical protein
MKRILVTITLLITLCGASIHPVHVSVTEISFDEKEKELEIISRIFWDDLEKSIRTEKKQSELNLLEPGTSITTDQLVGEYLQKRFKITLDGKAPQKIKYLGHEVENEAILCYVQVANVKKFETIEIYNSVLTELYEDQSNLVHVTRKGTVKSLRLMQDNPSGKLTFDKK